MIKFTKNGGGLNLDQSYMYSTNVEPSPMIKVNDKDTSKDKFGGINDLDFFNNFCKELSEQNICKFKDNTEG